MGELIKEWIKSVLIEDSGMKTVVVYSGRFQPFHLGHYKTYEHLLKKFGKANVFIGTSNKTDNLKSPFNFKEKEQIMVKMFNIPPSQIVKIKNPYAPSEILNKFPKETTSFVTVVGEKDKNRLGGKYFNPYDDKVVKMGYESVGYVYVAPRLSKISGTDVRDMLSKGDDTAKVKHFKEIYKKFDKKIYDLVTTKLSSLYNEVVDRFITEFDLPNLIKEASTTPVSAKDLVDDGPGFVHGNFKTYTSESDKHAASLGWSVINYLMDGDMMEEFDTVWPKGPGRYQVSYFPSGKEGLKSKSIRYGDDFKGSAAYKMWAKHITKVATMVGYNLVDFMDADDSIEDSKNQPNNAQTPHQNITEGGAYGHMSHPFDIQMNLTFEDLRTIIKKALNGNLKLTREKTDGQALAISWRDDKGLIAARNKGHLKNSGENALDISGVASKFQGRGALTDAYNFAMKDLSDAIKALSSTQRDKIFMQGKSFMNLEVIYPTSVNVIPYNNALLVFHNTTEYNDDGNAVGANQEAARILAGMIKQVNKDVQSKYKIQGPPVVELPKNIELSKLQSKFNSELNKLQNEFKLKGSDGVADYHQAWWENWVDSNSPITLDNREKMGLVKRWAFDDKSFRLDTKNLTDPKLLEWAKKTDKTDKVKLSKQNIKKFEDIFLGVGAEVLSFMSSVLTVNPDAAVRAMKKRLDTTIKDVKKSNDPKKIEKLKLELDRLAAIGGKDKIVPNEGIVFVYKDNTYKLTGAFASLNQIVGLMYY
jgi:cytidyltransferase-like protein